MSDSFLSQEEVDALLEGVTGESQKSTTEEVEAGIIRQYDISSQERIVRGRMPTMEIVNERFARNFRIGLFNFIRRSPEVSVGTVSVQRYSAQQHTGNPVLDVILTTKERTCADRGITFTAVADGSLLDGMSSMDIASLFGNALDNAIEATLKLPNPEQRLIKLALFEQNHFIVIRVENYYDSRLSKDADGNLRTTKRDDQHRHGFGVKSIRHIAQQYGGEVTIRTDNHWFVLTALIPRRTGLMAM